MSGTLTLKHQNDHEHAQVDKFKTDLDLMKRLARYVDELDLLGDLDHNW